MKLKKKKKELKRELPAVRCFKWLVILLHINLSIADDNVENNDQVIIPGFETGTFRVIGRHDKDNNKKSRQDQIKNIFDYAELKYH